MSNDIRIGTLVKGGEETKDYIKAILPHGFESFSITFWQTIGNNSLEKIAEDVNSVLKGTDAVISTLSVFGNPLDLGEEGQETRRSWEKIIDAAPMFGADIVSGFTGRVVDKSIPDNISRFKEVWEPLAERAAAKNVRIAFENCSMGGDWNSGNWNIAISPAAWELMFDALPYENLGLEWEPCHQMVQLINPMPQIHEWRDRLFHIHGKDATIHHHTIAKHGISGPEPFAYHRTPGFGDSNWTEIISELRRSGFKGSIDIEGWHDPVYREELEMTGQVHALNYLKRCRGGDFVPNP